MLFSFYVQEAVDIFGLSALDRLFCFMIVRELQRFLKYLQRNLMKLEPFVRDLKSFVKMSEDPNSLIRE
jgi:WASH complex subunit strumpellin